MIFSRLLHNPLSCRDQSATCQSPNLSTVKVSLHRWLPGWVVCAMLVWCVCKVYSNSAGKEVDAIIPESLSGGLNTVERLSSWLPCLTGVVGLARNNACSHANVNINLTSRCTRRSRTLHQYPAEAQFNEPQ